MQQVAKQGQSKRVTVRIDQEHMKSKQEEEQEKGKAVIQGIVSRGHTVEIEAHQVREEEKIETEAKTIKDSKETISREMEAETGMEKNKEALPEIRAPL